MKFNYVHENVYIYIEHDKDSVHKIIFTGTHKESEPESYGKTIKKELDEYFNGTLKKFTLKFHFKGTKFQQDVLRAMYKVPYGNAISYSELAERAGYKKAYRAAASVCSHNDLVILLPCHRIIASDGGYGGFGNDVGLKIRLLKHEGYSREKK